MMSDSALSKELSSVLNRVSRENMSNTPDFILAEYMLSCLIAFEKASNAREQWYGKGLSIFGIQELNATKAVEVEI